MSDQLTEQKTIYMDAYANWLKAPPLLKSIWSSARTIALQKLIGAGLSFGDIARLEFLVCDDLGMEWQPEELDP